MTQKEYVVPLDEDDLFMKLPERPYKWTPQEIAATIHKDYGIIGQEQAVKAAAQIVYNHFEGRPSCSLFIGPTGCGKTEIWRAISKEMGSSAVQFLDGSSLQAEGWHGGVKLSSVFRSLSPDSRSRIILVIDEADKLIQPKFGRGGTNYSDLIQDSLLKMCDHDTLLFNSEGEATFSVDCVEVSVVLLGAFESVRRSKMRLSECRSIGFNAPFSRKMNDPSFITIEDLIDFGMKTELAGRINKIIHLSPLQLDDMKDIGYRYIQKLMGTVHNKIEIDDNTMSVLAQEAIDRGFGARFLKSRIDQLLDESIWEDPYCTYTYSLHLSSANRQPFFNS